MLLFGLALLAGGLGVLVALRREIALLRPRGWGSWIPRRVLKFWVYRLLGGSVTHAHRAGRPAGRDPLPEDEPRLPEDEPRPPEDRLTQVRVVRAVGRASPPPSAVVRRAAQRPVRASGPRPRRTS